MNSVVQAYAAAIPFSGRSCGGKLPSRDWWAYPPIEDTAGVTGRYRQRVEGALAARSRVGRATRANRGSRQRSLLSADGVERATAMGVAILKGMNATQAVAIVLITLSTSRRPWLEVLAVTAYGPRAGSRRRLLRAGRLRRGLVLVDVSIGIAVLLLAPLFQPSQAHKPGPVASVRDFPDRCRGGCGVRHFGHRPDLGGDDGCCKAVGCFTTRPEACVKTL